VNLALGVFANCKTENALCKAGFLTLAEMRELNTTIVATQILMDERHPIRHFFTNRTFGISRTNHKELQKEEYKWTRMLIKQKNIQKS
jgi:hypothetical protein